MLNWLKKIVSQEVVKAVIGPSRPRLRGKNGGTSRPERLAPGKAGMLRRRAIRRQDEARALRRTEHLYPPQQGSRRPEWSSAIPKRWSSLNGLPATTPTGGN
jgi:hypothetical protein